MAKNRSCQVQRRKRLPAAPCTADRTAMSNLCRSPFRRRHFVAALLSFVFWHPVPSPAADAGGAKQAVQFWFVRHGESDINVATIAHPQPDEGATYPLTRKGMQQALALAETLSSAPITAIYTSTRVRALQTADAIAFRHDLAVKLAPEAVELNDGMAIDDPNGGQAYRDLVRRWLVEKDLNARVGEGESFADVQRRFLPFMRELMNRHADDTGVVVVVSHGATLGLFVPVLAPNVPADYVLNHPVPNTGIIKTELRDGRLVCVDWAGSRDFAAAN